MPFRCSCTSLTPLGLWQSVFSLAGYSLVAHIVGAHWRTCREHAARGNLHRCLTVASISLAQCHGMAQDGESLARALSEGLVECAVAVWELAKDWAHLFGWTLARIGTLLRRLQRIPVKGDR